ncbi:RDD family protein [Streptomyces sp. ODS28]|uniref:RDD family protein n=1 Tax=Streptomyces sp. ODS28 TaxID=3136688 RepID=UPI0031ED6F16
MTTEQPGNDPFRKQESSPQGEPEQDSGGSSPPPPPPGQGPYGGSGNDPYAGGNPYAAGGPYGSGDPYGAGHPQGAGSPYGEPDPLAGMPPLASRGKRLLARIVDALLIGIPIGIILALVQSDVSPADSGNTFAQSLIYQLVYLIYEGLMLTTSGQTVGKRLMRIRVAVLSDGAIPKGSPGWFRAGVYSLPALIPCIGSLFWLVNVLFCTWDKPYRQCLHDKAAKTVVVATD